MATTAQSDESAQPFMSIFEILARAPKARRRVIRIDSNRATVFLDRWVSSVVTHSESVPLGPFYFSLSCDRHLLSLSCHLWIWPFSGKHPFTSRETDSFLPNKQTNQLATYEE